MELDRATIPQHGKTEHSGNYLIDDAELESRTATQHMVESIKKKKHETGAQLRRAFHVSPRNSGDFEPNSTILADTSGEKSGNRLDNWTEPEKHTAKDFVHNPVDTVKSKMGNQGNHELAANIAAKEIDHGQEVDLVNASTAVDRARTENERLFAIQNLEELLEERQSTYVRWTLDRHVTKLRVLPENTTTIKNPRKAFERINAQGEVTVDWRAYGEHLLETYANWYGERYIGYGDDPPTPSKATIMPNVERLIVATSPFQELIMTIRHVYRWESLAETWKYLIAYVVLWWYNLLLPGILSALLYHVVQHRLHGNTIEDLRRDIKHTEDVQRGALSLTEFIEKEGDENWADELLQSVGPWLMVQLADLANFFESVLNFYEWRDPSRTKVVLGELTVVILVTAIIPLWLLVKSMTLGAGFTFFCLFPISANFPKYRLLVSPTKQFLWNVPTHAEWAVETIQARGKHVEEQALLTSPAVLTETMAKAAHVPTAFESIQAKDGRVEPPTLPVETTVATGRAQDYAFYKARCDGDSGRLIISTSSIRFESSVGHAPRFILPYNQIASLEKGDRQVTKSIPHKLKKDSGRDLTLLDKVGKQRLLKSLDQRDEAFSQIVGFSKSKWQVVW